MATLTIKLPSQPEQTDFNLRRWNELAGDPGLTKIEGPAESYACFSARQRKLNLKSLSTS